MDAWYEENNCRILVRGGEPYLILNIEEFVNLNRLNQSHCDFLYITYNRSRSSCRVFLVELKHVGGALDAQRILRLINDFLDNKIPQTKSLIINLLNQLGVRNPNFSGILVLPSQIVNRLLENRAIFARIVHKFRDSWITACDTDIWEKMFP